MSLCTDHNRYNIIKGHRTIYITITENIRKITTPHDHQCKGHFGNKLTNTRILQYHEKYNSKSLANIQMKLKTETQCLCMIRH